MKKLLLAIIMAGSAHYASAQFSSPTKTTFGIKGGVNFANVSQQMAGSTASLSAGNLTTFSAGLFIDIAVSESFSIQPGVYYSNKGYKFDGGFDYGIGTIENINIQTKITYIQVPLNFLYNVNTNAGKLFIGGGPFAAVAIKARNKGQITADEEAYFDDSGSADLDAEQPIGKEGGLKRMDYGVTGLAGFRLNNGLLISANYDLGLANINFSSEEGKIKTRTIGISLGFSF
jgi:hypothetical protein